MVTELLPLTSEAIPVVARRDLQSYHHQFIRQHAPIFIQPSSDPTIDAIVRIEFDGNFDARDNYANRTRLTNKEPAVIYYDYMELGGFIGVSYMAYRPFSIGVLAAHRQYERFIPRILRRAGVAIRDSYNHPHDTESATLVFKKGRLGSSFADRAMPEAELIASITNAHGIPLAAVPEQAFKTHLKPNFSATGFGPRGIIQSLSPVSREQASRRLADMADDRMIIYSEPGTHALVTVSNLNGLPPNINTRETIIYFPADAELPTLRKRFPNALFKPYSLIELAPIIFAHKNTLLAPDSPRLWSLGPVTTWDGELVDVRTDIPSEFMDDDGRPSGANLPPFWGVTNVLTPEGEALEPQTHTDGRRSAWATFHEVAQLSFHVLVTQKEIEQGALKPVHNRWVQRVN